MKVLINIGLLILAGISAFIILVNRSNSPEISFFNKETALPIGIIIFAGLFLITNMMKK